MRTKCLLALQGWARAEGDIKVWGIPLTRNNRGIRSARPRVKHVHQFPAHEGCLIEVGSLFVLPRICTIFVNLAARRWSTRCRGPRRGRDAHGCREGVNNR